jgi:catechol 2,3-dioxygenase-like lactoylglutathione lyase family enzyme
MYRHPVGPPMPDATRFLYSGIRVRQLAKSLAFYKKLGFRIKSRGVMEHGGEWLQLVFPRSYHRLELNYYPKGNRFYEPFRTGTEFDHFGFYSPDPAAWKRKALRAGATTATEFVEGTQRIVYLRDPDGNWLEAFGPAHPRRRRSAKK